MIYFRSLRGARSFLKKKPVLESQELRPRLGLFQCLSNWDSFVLFVDGALPVWLALTPVEFARSHLEAAAVANRGGLQDAPCIYDPL
jgi:hypothetical protein